MPQSTCSTPDLDDLLCFAVHSTGFAFNRIYRRVLSRLNLTYPQYLVMLALWREDGVTVGQLGERLSLDTNTLTPLLKRLEALALLTRRRSTEDERRVLVALSDTGRAMQQDARSISDCIAADSGLPLADLHRLTRELQMLRGSLERAAAEQGGS